MVGELIDGFIAGTLSHVRDDFPIRWTTWSVKDS
jgi:hypothetical protein